MFLWGWLGVAFTTSTSTGPRSPQWPRTSWLRRRRRLHRTGTIGRSALLPQPPKRFIGARLIVVVLSATRWPACPGARDFKPKTRRTTRHQGNPARTIELFIVHQHPVMSPSRSLSCGAIPDYRLIDHSLLHLGSTDLAMIRCNNAVGPLTRALTHQFGPRSRERLSYPQAQSAAGGLISQQDDSRAFLPTALVRTWVDFHFIDVPPFML